VSENERVVGLISMNRSTIMTDYIPLSPADAAWLLVLVQNAVPADTDPDSPTNWEGLGRQHALSMLAGAAGAHPDPCAAPGCALGPGHSADHYVPAWRTA
jgi:hypothetical protein